MIRVKVGGEWSEGLKLKRDLETRWRRKMMREGRGLIVVR